MCYALFDMMIVILNKYLKICIIQYVESFLLLLLFLACQNVGHSFIFKKRHHL